MSEQTTCPNCGCPLSAPEPRPDSSGRDSGQSAVIAALEQEIRKLRETVALLRGSRAG